MPLKLLYDICLINLYFYYFSGLTIAELMGVIFLIGAGQALFYISLMLSKKQKQTADFVLLAWLFAMGLHLLSYYALHAAKFDSSFWKIIILLLPPLIYSHGPLLYLYLKVLTQERQEFKTKYLFHFIPFLVSLCYYYYTYFFIAKGDANYFINGNREPQYLLMIFYSLNIFLNPVYVVVVLIKLAKHRKKIKNNFSYLENINLNWLRFMAIGLGSISIVVWIVIFSKYLKIVDINFEDDSYIYLSLVLFVFITGFFGFKQGVIYKFALPEEKHNEKKMVKGESNEKDEPEKETESDKYEKSQLTKGDANQIVTSLSDLMKTEEPYKQNQLSLNDVAEKLNIPSHNLSQVLNVYLETNFYNYINKFRVEEVKRMLNNKKFEHYSLLGIAHEAGFNSKSAFNRIFKNVTGQTPTQYKSAI